jgi:hypothetical protein
VLVGRQRGRPRAACLSRLLGLALTAGLLGLSSAPAAALTLQTDQVAGPPMMGLGVQWDPYDAFQPTPEDWNLTFQRLDYMQPGFFRVVEPAYDYFRGYDSDHNPTYRWDSTHVMELRTILDYAKSRGITVVLGDWSNPMLNGDARIPAGFLQQLHDTYGYTNIKYYNLINEPNYVSGCDFSCWAGEARALLGEFAARGMNRWLSLVGPDNGNSWDDTPSAQSADRTSGLDGDNPIGGDYWVTATLNTIPSLIGAYDSHRYATAQGLEAGVYQAQMYARREQINNLDSPQKVYFEGEAGLTARQVSPFSAHGARDARALAPLLDPSAQAASGFVDSQPHIREFRYGVWMGDMAIQALSAGLGGASAWDLDDAIHVGGQYGSQNLKQWGFWNSYGGQDGYPASDRSLRPWFYPWAVLARSFPAGSQPLLTPTTHVAGLRVAAAKVPQGNGYGLSLAVVNDTPRPHSLRLVLPAATAPLTLDRYDYFPSDRAVDDNGLPVPAGVLRGVSLAGGIRVQLPARGLVVLSSVGHGTIRLDDGTQSLVDRLDGWGEVYARSRSIKLDHTNPWVFSGDSSRAVSAVKHPQYLVYRMSHMTSFVLKTYFHETERIRVLDSADGRRWAPVRLASTPPAPAMGGHGWYLAELVPADPLGDRPGYLKLELLDRHAQLSQVIIQSRRRPHGP